MDIDDAVDWRLIARMAQAKIERLKAALVALLASYEKNYDRGEEGIYSPWEEQVFRDATALVNEQRTPNAETRAAMKEIEDGGGELTDKHPE